MTSHKFKELDRAPFALIVNDDPKKGGGTGRKYKSVEEAVQVAQERIAAGIRHGATMDDGSYICIPIAHIGRRIPIPEPVKTTLLTYPDGYCPTQSE